MERAAEVTMAVQKSSLIPGFVAREFLEYFLEHYYQNHAQELQPLLLLRDKIFSSTYQHIKKALLYSICEGRGTLIYTTYRDDMDRGLLTD